MANNGRISLKSPLQFKMFKEAMDVLSENKLNLTDYDRRLFQDLEDGLDMFGNDLSLTVKQFNHIRGVAFDFQKGC